MGITSLNGTWTVILSAIVAIIVGILVNVLTPIIQDWLNESVVSTRGKTLSRLKKEYARIKLWHDNPSLLAIDIALLVALITLLLPILVLTVVGISAITLSSVMSFSVENRPVRAVFEHFNSFLQYMNIGIALISAITLISLIKLSAFLADIFRLRNFETYEKVVLERINKLQVK